MRIVLNETETDIELQLEVNKVDTPTGVGWSVLTSQGRTVLIKFRDGAWHAENENSISPEFWQMVGDEIEQVLGADCSAKEVSSANPRPKRARILKYLLV